MSWFKRKNNPPVAHIEPTIRLIERDIEELEDVTPPAATTGDTMSAPAVSEDGQASQGEAESHLHVRVVKPHDVVDVEAHPVPDVAPVSGDAKAKVPGRFAALAARLKRAPTEPQLSLDTTVAADLDVEVQQTSVDLSTSAADNSATTPESVPADGSADSDMPAEAAPASSKGFKGFKGFKGLGARTSGSRGDKPKFSVVPVRVVIGFLPEVTERDALEYAVGIAEKHFEQIGMSYFDAFEFGSGYAFEAHEGGTGKAYLPEIIRYFESKGAFRPGEQVSAVIRTATRAVEVQRTRDGLVAIILPERDETPPSDWLEPTTSMQPAINKRTGFLVAGAALFTTGFIAMMVTSMLTRFQEYDAAPEPVMHRIESSQLPNQQWSMIASIPANNFVRALRYRNGRWESPEIVAGAVPVTTAPTSTTAPGPAPTAAHPATPPVAPPAPAVTPAQGPALPNTPATQGAAR